LRYVLENRIVFLVVCTLFRKKYKWQLLNFIVGIAKLAIYIIIVEIKLNRKENNVYQLLRK